MGVLRLALDAYTAPRSIGCDGVYSRKVCATRGITAGSGTATAELRTIILDLLEDLAKDFPTVKAAIYVDDVNLETSEGIDDCKYPPPPKRATTRVAIEYERKRAQQLAKATLRTAATIARATNAVVAFFHARDMQVSETKSCIVLHYWVQHPSGQNDRSPDSWTQSIGGQWQQRTGGEDARGGNRGRRAAHHQGFPEALRRLQFQKKPNSVPLGLLGSTSRQQRAPR